MPTKLFCFRKIGSRHLRIGGGSIDIQETLITVSEYTHNKYTVVVVIAIAVRLTY